MRLHDLRATPGARHAKRRIGRGHGSGQGTTAGKGTKGQKARSGGGVPLYFEGGQLPLVRRLPYRRGFKNPFRVEFAVVNVADLAGLPAGATVTVDTLVGAGLVNRGEGPVKVLGDGALDVALHVQADRVSRQAREKIEAAGGSVTELTPRKVKVEGKKAKAKAAKAAEAKAAKAGGEAAEATAASAPAGDAAPAARPARRPRGEASAEAAPAAAEPTSAPEATAAGEGATAAEEKPE
jgi:large subunit ribosomal protein L15